MKKYAFLFVLLTAAAAVILPSCYLGKTIDKPVTVYVDDAAMRMQLSLTCPSAKYLYYKTEDAYREEFRKSLLHEASFSKNVTIVDKLPADYVLSVGYFVVIEGESKETVNDEKSSYNGQSYMLSYINTKAEFDIKKDNQSIGHYTASADKSEKLKNNQHLGQMIIGTNKDNTMYREKLMPDDVCMDFAGKCGRRTWNLFTQKLAKKMK